MPDHPPVPPLRGLRWSAATAAFQVEGARTAGGRGRSIWDDFVETPGAVRDGSTAEPGPDSYHRYREDVDLLARLGVDRYRFSISWVRVQPTGSGEANPDGIGYYDRVVDELLAAGVTPFPTLYHWDLPSIIEERGGWLDRDTAYRFADYSALVADALGDRVTHWYTINEPVSTSLQGYAIGELAPARQLLFASLPTVHHQLLGHGLATRVLRGRGAQTIGIVNNHTDVRAASPSADDQTAAHVYDVLHNRIFAEPVLLGSYPDIEALGMPPMPVEPGDLEIISTPTDVYGLNFYNPTTIGAAPSDSPVPFVLVLTPDAAHTGFGVEWPIVPSALTDLLVDFHERYGESLPPIIVAENGASFPEPDAVDGAIQDDDRIAYLRGHIAAVGEARDRGVRIDEYTVWSLLDNFEWAEGFTQRFGLVHVDHETGRRTPKASFDWYRTLIEEARS
ncbi:GH1 family beta-glucosidase [Microbacterium terricola]|uniref:Beta-glucosidase n=1 Tax=Microbacterium terricola TaxID=344163 RepID=A0ABM8DYS8_9MICO|nr:GH1 family beta-glucosidase [Microbacterium terricola]UYK41488.1 GH1 family beta-glucosidase [Microbacterium terricola]BDV30722.1 beta-glucosidase [Microbacterium terricola]